MPSPFVWFDNVGGSRTGTAGFLKDAFGWVPHDTGTVTLMTAQEQDKPFLAMCDAMDGVSGWVPYLEVDDLSAAVENARKHGAEVVVENLNGPAGDASFIRDPGGSPIALWKRAGDSK